MTGRDNKDRARASTVRAAASTEAIDRDKARARASTVRVAASTEAIGRDKARALTVRAAALIRTKTQIREISLEETVRLTGIIPAQRNLQQVLMIFPAVKKAVKNIIRSTKNNLRALMLQGTAVLCAARTICARQST